MEYYLAIDLGASSGRHILAHEENGKLITEEIYRFANGATEREINGERRLFWEVERLFQEILNGLKRAKELGKIPSSVGVDTWGVDYALLDENDELCGGVYSYRDPRTKAAVDDVHAILPFETLYARTGIQFNSFNTVYQLYDDQKTGRLKRAKTFLMLPDYFHFLLTGEKRQEYTNATTTGLVNAQTHEWDGEILQALGYEKSLFNELSQPSSAVGEFTDEIAKIVGYKAKVILPATHDTASAVLAAPLFSGAPYISSGTWSLLGVEQPVAHVDERARTADYSNEGSVNFTFRLQKNIMGLWIIQQVRRELEGDYDFATLAELARQNPTDAEIDVNDERFYAPKSMIEAIDGAVGKPLSVGERAYCVFNSLAKSYASSLADLENLTGQRYDRLHIIGGGSKNGLLNELTAKHTGKRIVTGPTEGTALGNLMMQMLGCGAIKSVADGRTLVKNSFDIVELN